MTWQVGPTVLTCQVIGHWHGMPTGHDDVILIQVWHVGRVIWYSGWVSSSGWRRRVWHVARVCARGQSPRRHVTVREDCSDVRFWRGFYQWLRLFLVYTVVWSKHNFDNFNFWAKSNTPLNHVLWYQLLGDSNRWCSDSCPLEAKHTDTIFYVVRQIAYIHGRGSFY
jgi:hypothetical protein